MKAPGQLPHYSTHAREFFQMAAELLPARTGIPSDFEAFLADYLHESVKFILPDNGFLFAADEHDYKPSMFDLLQLPYPACALEFTAGDELFAQDSGLEQSRKRIALCFDPWQLPEWQKERLSALRGQPWFTDIPKRALAAMAVFEMEDMWAAAVGMVVIDLEGDKPMLIADVADGELTELSNAVGQRIRRRHGKHGLPATFMTFPIRSVLLGQSSSEAMECLYIDTIDEIRVVYEFLAAVNCANVGTQTIHPPQMLNAKRAKKGKTPFYPYKVLDLSPAGGEADQGGRAGGGGHASPRTHLRRGHLRRLHERHGGKTIWINATAVNSRKGEALAEQVYVVRT